MKKPLSGIWIRNGWRLYYLHGQKLILALLLREKPMSLAQLAAAFAEKGIESDSRELEKMLASLEKANVLALRDGVYVCNAAALAKVKATYTQEQLIDLISMTQSMTGGKAFYSVTPPMSVNSQSGGSV